AEDGIRDFHVTGVQTCALPISPVVNNNGQGKRLFNSALLIENQSVQQIVHKTLLPDYDVFDECRYFEANREPKCITFKGYKIARSEERRVGKECRSGWAQ